jgi:hypothetical protein
VRQHVIDDMEDLISSVFRDDDDDEDGCCKTITCIGVNAVVFHVTVQMSIIRKTDNDTDVGFETDERIIIRPTMVIIQTRQDRVNYRCSAVVASNMQE